MKRALLCTLIAAALLLCACTRASESTVRAPDAGAPLTLCLGAGPVTLDPARTENGIGATYVVNLFAGLTGYRTGGDGTAELTPELCASLPEPEALPDGRVRYVFTLRDGLTWSDGTPLTAADFVYAWNRACTLEDAAAPYLFACIDGYGTGWLNVAASPDGRTLTVVLAETMPTFLQLCAQPAYAPVPSGAADTASWTADGAVFAASGPYTVAEWTTEGLTYTKNPAYWDADNVAAETVRFVFQSDPNVAESAFLAREYALSWPVPDAALDDLRTNHAPELRTVSQLGTYSLCFSMSDPALSVFPKRSARRSARRSHCSSTAAISAARSRPARSRARMRPSRPASRTPTAAPLLRTTVPTARAAAITAAITRPTASRPLRSCGRWRSRPAGSRSTRRVCVPGSRS